ncbi:DNA polymerase III delta prime subunit [Candidatus Enterovibrio altilux]|uniref:DNA polymerase III subunit delta' n=1 Tax=Candidatus Enterovibrio altilux TaxID=1927128 RepID=A0A291BBV0_9GAMM|nr:DNA polymerase III delta prime subunit [Candidatus Enterovibrio luxaltus]
MCHAVLFTAPKGNGRLALAAMLAKTLLCENSVTEPCSICHSCQLFEAETHPDFHVIKPETEGKKISVDAVRTVNKYAWETSHLGGRCIILIQNADSMGEAAANAVLKTLEEPPLNCYFILFTASIDHMLTTVVSRCDKWHLKLPHESVVKCWVESELFESVPLQVIRINRGAPLAAKAFVERGSLALHEELITEFSAYVALKQNLFIVTKKLIKSGSDALQWLSFLLLDVMKLQLGTTEGIVHSDSMILVEQISYSVSFTLVMRQLTALNRLKNDLIKNSGLNHELMLSRWLSDFQ